MISSTFLAIIVAIAIGVFILVGKSRLATLARNRASDLGEVAANALANPVNDGLAEIREAKKDADRIQAEIAELNGLNVDLERQVQEAKADVSKFERIAIAAGKAGNAADVKSAVDAKKRAQQTADEISATITANNDLKATLDATLSDLVSDIEDAERTQVSDAIRIKNAGRREAAAKRVASIAGAGDRFASAKKLKDTAAQAEAKAAAWETTAKGAPKAKIASLEDRYATEGATDDEVSKYLAKPTA